MTRQTIRLTADIDERVQSTAKQEGYANPSAFLRAAIAHELSGREETIIGAEERLAASMEQIRREIFRNGRAQQALFAFVDSLAKVLLTCVPEPGGEAMESAVARARGRHAKAAEGRRPSDGRGFAIGHAGFGRPQRRMTKANPGCDHGRRQCGLADGVGGIACGDSCKLTQKPESVRIPGYERTKHLSCGYVPCRYRIAGERGDLRKPIDTHVAGYYDHVGAEGGRR